MIKMFSQNIQVISLLNEEDCDELKTLQMLYQLKNKRKRSTTHQMYKKRAEEGAYNILILKHLIDSDTLFKEYFRLTPMLFNTVLSFIKIDLELVPVRHFQTISPEEQLCITLRLVVSISFVSFLPSILCADKIYSFTQWCLRNSIEYILFEVNSINDEQLI